MTALRWGGQGIVLAWACAALVWASDSARPLPPEALAARVRPVAEPPLPSPVPAPETAEDPPLVEPPEPAPPPRAAPEPEPAEPSPERVGEAELARGSELLDGAGAFPVLSFSYEDFPSFRAYARAMRALGARFVVVRRREIVASVDIESGVLTEASVGHGFSPRARDYSGEPGLDRIARSARERFGAGSVVMMLVPRAVDAGLFGGIARVLARHGEPRGRLREIRGRYQRAPGGGLRLRVDAAVRRDGTRLELGTLFDLGQIAGAART